MCVLSNSIHLGYARQQFSNLVVDLVAGKLLDPDEWTGVVDCDAYFMTPVVPEDLFRWNPVTRNWTARITGYNGHGSSWDEGATFSIGAPSIGEFMVLNGFPIMMKVSHIAMMRAHITAVLRPSEPILAFADEPVFAICLTTSALKTLHIIHSLTLW